MSNTEKLLSFLSMVFVAVLIFIALNTTRDKIKEQPAVGGNFGVLREVTFFNATTTTATSTTAQAATLIDSARNVTMFFQRGDTTGQGNSGSTEFKVEVSRDNSTWIQYNKLIDNVANTNSQEITRVSSVTLPAGTSTKFYNMDLTNESFKYLRCVATEATDGEHTCRALIRY